jgi:flagellar hook-basal body complex protein FliE
MINPTAAAGAYSSIQGLSSGASRPFGGMADLGGAGGADDFTSLLKRAVDGVAESGRKAESQAATAIGGRGDLVDVVTAVAESETALQTLVAVRDRMISAYEEIMRMQI